MNKSENNFFEQVYAVVKKIPEGRVTSYGAIANFLSAKNAARMVGWAMNASHTDPEIPAHRVVNRNGVLTGKNFFGEGVMQDRLESEGLVIQEDQIIDFPNSVSIFFFFRFPKNSQYFEEKLNNINV